MVIKKVDGINIDARELQVRDCEFSDLEMLERFQSAVVDEIPLEQIWGTYSADALRNDLELGGEIKLYYDGDEFVGWLFLIINNKDEFDKHGALDVNLEETAIYGGVMIASKYWGNGLQKQMTLEIEKMAREKGFKYIAGTVAPTNIYSYNNLMDSGYRVIAEKEMAKGNRYIILKDL